VIQTLKRFFTRRGVSRDHDRPYRVLYFDHTSVLGGGEIALLNLLRHLDRKRITPMVVLCSGGPFADQLRNVCEVYVLPLPERVRKTRKDSLGWRSVLNLRDFATVAIYSIRLARFAVKHDAKLIHTNSLKADIIGGLAGRLVRCPVVWHIRDRIEDDYLPRLIVRAFRLLCRFLPTYVVANSQAVLKTLHLPGEQSQVAIPSGVDLRSRVVHDGTISPPDPAVSVGSGHKIALIGRISLWKGQHIFLQAAATVRRRFPNARFKIVGAALFGEQHYEMEVRQLGADLGLDDAVEFTGFCANVPELIVNFDIVVHASITGEPFGQVIIEAMAAGKPVVATDGGGVPEIVQNGETGILVPMGNVQAMADAICRLVADPALAKAMGLRGQQRVRAHFGVEQTARKVEAVYEAIITN